MNYLKCFDSKTFTSPLFTSSIPFGENCDCATIRFLTMQRIKQTLARWAGSMKTPSPVSRVGDGCESMNPCRLGTTSKTDATALLAKLFVSETEAELGPSVLYSADDDAACGVDIVFVHDVYGHREKSWTKSSVCWPRDLLCEDIPGIRVISVSVPGPHQQYSTANPFSQWGWALGAVNDRALSKIAEESSIADSMLDDLVRLRSGQSASRSIIFIAHGCGGLVVKEAISTAAISRIYGNGAHNGVATIYAHTIGVMFLGTVHSASPGQTLGQTLAEVSRISPPHVTSTLSSFLEAQSDFLEKVATDFKLFTRDIPVVCIQEDSPTPAGRVSAVLDLCFGVLWLPRRPADLSTSHRWCRKLRLLMKLDLASLSTRSGRTTSRWLGFPADPIRATSKS